MSDPGGVAAPPGRRGVVVLFAVVTVLALGLRLWAPGPTTETYDENLWLQRSDLFASAVVHGHWSAATAAQPSLHLTNPTMPGVTTMWAGVLGRQIARASGALGWSTPVHGPSATSPQVLRAAQGVIGVATTTLLLLTMVLLWRLLSARVALFTGGLLAVEPWLVGHSQQLHTDALVAMCSIAALCAFAWALHDGDGRDAGAIAGEARTASEQDGTVRRGWLIVAAALVAAALLTKTNAVGILGPGLALVAWDAWRTGTAARRRALLRAAGTGFVTVAVVCVVAWPALLTAPIDQVRAMADASKQVARTRLRFFHGAERGFVPGFYVVALGIRLSPWLLVWCTVGVVGGVGDLLRRWRVTDDADGSRAGRPGAVRVPTWMLLAPLPYFVVVSLSRFGYDRYALAVVPFAVIAGACVADRWSRRVTGFGTRTPTVLAVGGVACLLVAATVAVRQAPFGTQYADGVIGGLPRAVEWIPVETELVSSRLDADLRRHLGGRCDGVRVAAAHPHPASDTCGESFTPTTVKELTTADYAVTFGVGAQPQAQDWFSPWLRRHATPIDTFELDGVVAGRLWKLSPDGS